MTVIGFNHLIAYIRDVKYLVFEHQQALHSSPLFAFRLFVIHDGGGNLFLSSSGTMNNKNASNSFIAV